MRPAQLERVGKRRLGAAPWSTGMQRSGKRDRVVTTVETQVEALRRSNQSELIEAQTGPLGRLRPIVCGLCWPYIAHSSAVAVIQSNAVYLTRSTLGAIRLLGGASARRFSFAPLTYSGH